MMKNRATGAYVAIHISYWVMCCSVLAFASTFLLSRGISNSVIGVAVALGYLLSTVAQGSLGSRMDRVDNRTFRRTIVMISLLMLLPAAALIFAGRTVWVNGVCVMLLIALLFAMQPLLNAIPVRIASSGARINFGLARGAGSVSYAVTSVIVGQLVARLGTGVLPVVYLITPIVFCLIVANFRYMGEGGVSCSAGAEEERGGTMAFLRKYRSFLFLLLGTMIIFCAYSTIDVFAIQVLRNLGGDSGALGIAIFISASLELPSMASFRRLEMKFGTKKILCFGAIMIMTKYLLITLSTSVAMYYCAMTLQMLGYALYFPALISYAGQTMAPEDTVKGQALVTMATTLNGVVASLGGGMLLDTFGVRGMLVAGSIFSVAGAFLIICSVRTRTQKVPTAKPVLRRAS